MIPYPITPLTGLSIIVTRPATQAAALCTRMSALGASVTAFPTIAIESIAVQSLTQSYDQVIFVSANAVEHGLAYVPKSISIAAIGPATAKALVDAKRAADCVAPAPHNSEALLELPQFTNVANQHILIVRGEGGRETLRETLIARGTQVDYLDVYRRTPVVPTPQSLAQLNELGHDQVDLITLTSVEILEQWLALLGPSATHFSHIAFVVPSERIETAARSAGLQGECILATAANDDALIGAIAGWHARAR